jgi:hypothetical protein
MPGRIGTALVASATLLLVAVASCAGQGDCRYNSDCKGAYCSDGACKKDCVDATIDCPRGYLCNAVAQCELPGADGGVTDGASADGALPDGSAADGAAPDAGTGMPLLSLCGSDGDCASGLCRPWSKGDVARCTRTCATNTDCATGARCATIGAETYCVGSDIGRTCTAGNPAVCTAACLTAQGYCTATCQSGADCPNGYGCQAVGTPATSVCVKAEGECAPGSATACIAPAACDTSPNLIVASCTLACTTAADCPQRAEGLPPWTCDGLCRRPGDVYGPLAGGARASYACDAATSVVSVCNDGQHIDFDAFLVPAPPAVSCAATMTTDGVAGDSCVNSCRSQGGCVHGFACTAVGSVNGNRIGLCLPALGAGEVGVACSKHASCFFGYCNAATGKCSRDCTADGLCPAGSTCNATGGPPVEGRPFRRCE